MFLILPLLIGYLLDRLFGDPEFLPHPIVGFGRVIAFAEKKLNKGKHKVVKGAFVSILFPLSIFSILLIINILCYKYLYVVGIIFNSICVFFALSGKTLIKEVKAVFEATDKSLDAGRKQIARIVGRDTSQLSEQQIKIAALETLSENLSDGVIAPLFWYLIAGVPGILAYKMTNTLDSMVGYKSERYKDFGRWSAKIDDIANFVPARLTAFIMIIVSRQWEVFSFVKKYSSKHSSPNAGFPESALAGILNCRFGGGNFYFGSWVEKPFIGHNERLIDNQDLYKSLKTNILSEYLMVLIVALIQILLWLV